MSDESGPLQARAQDSRPEQHVFTCIGTCTYDEDRDKYNLFVHRLLCRLLHVGHDALDTSKVLRLWKLKAQKQATEVFLEWGTNPTFTGQPKNASKTQQQVSRQALEEAEATFDALHLNISVASAGLRESGSRLQLLDSAQIGNLWQRIQHVKPGQMWPMQAQSVIEDFKLKPVVLTQATAHKQKHALLEFQDDEGKSCYVKLGASMARVVLPYVVSKLQQVTLSVAPLLAMGTIVTASEPPALGSDDVSQSVSSRGRGQRTAKRALAAEQKQLLRKRQRLVSTLPTEWFEEMGPSSSGQPYTVGLKATVVEDRQLWAEKGLTDAYDVFVTNPVPSRIKFHKCQLCDKVFYGTSQTNSRHDCRPLDRSQPLLLSAASLCPPSEVMEAGQLLPLHVQTSPARAEPPSPLQCQSLPLSEDDNAQHTPVPRGRQHAGPAPGRVDIFTSPVKALVQALREQGGLRQQGDNVSDLSTEYDPAQEQLQALQGADLVDASDDEEVDECFLGESTPNVDARDDVHLQPAQLRPRTPTPYKRFIHKHDLVITDRNSNEDWATWLRCPLALRGAEGGCCIQRHCLHEVMVLDTVGVMVLRVPRLKCRRHGREGPTSNETGCSFLVTNPVVWQCLQARSPGLLFEPSIAVVSDGLIVAEEVLRRIGGLVTDTLDMSMTARRFTQDSVGDAQHWMRTLSSKLEATAVQGKPHVQAMLLLVCENLDAGGGRQVSLRALGSKLNHLVPADPELQWLYECAEDLLWIVRLLTSQRGSASISRHTVKLIFLEYFRNTHARNVVAQLHTVRQMTGVKLAFDHTYGSTSTLTAPTSQALTAHSRRKLTGFNASLLTVTAEHGLIVAATIVPNDSQQYVKAVMHGLFQAPLDAGPLSGCSCVHEVAAIGGPLAKHPLLVCTDASIKDKHIWKTVAKPIAEACLRQEIPFMVAADGPLGTCDVADGMDAAGLSSTFKMCRQGNATDLQLGQLPRVVISQDIYHARERIFRKLCMTHRDKHALMSELKKILSMASCQEDPCRLISGSDWEDVDRQMATLVADLRRKLEDVLDRYQTTQTQEAASTAAGDVLKRAKALGRTLGKARRQLADDEQSAPLSWMEDTSVLTPMLPSEAQSFVTAERELVLPNPKFGGTEEEGLQLLGALEADGQKLYVPLQSVPLDAHLFYDEQSSLDDLHTACAADSEKTADGSIDGCLLRERLLSCHPEALAFFPQRSAMWQIIRQQRPFTASSLFNLLLLPCLHKDEHKAIQSPPYRQDVVAVKQALLCARQDVQGITDEQGLSNWLGSKVNTDFEQLSFNLQWGHAKEPYALYIFCQEVMRSNPDFAGCTLQQRGFMAADTRFSHKLPPSPLLLARDGAQAAHERVLGLSGASPDAVIVSPTGKMIAVVEAKSRVPFCSARQGLEEVWRYIPTIPPSQKLDPAHWVQLQLQMHACGVELAYLVSYTLTKGISVVTATYSPTFMHAAVPVMALVHELFIAPAKLDLDSVLETIGSHDKLNEARQNLWQAVQQEYQLHQLYLVDHTNSGVERHPLFTERCGIREGDPAHRPAGDGILAGPRGAAARKAIARLQQEDNARHILNNRLCKAVQGTSANEAFHRTLHRYLHNLGGNRSYAMLLAFTMSLLHKHNEGILKRLAGGRQAGSMALRSILSSESLQRTADAANVDTDVGVLRKLMDAQQSAEVLVERGFRAKTRPQTTWAPEDIRAVTDALIDLAEGRQQLPTRGEDVTYWLSHHVLEKRHSEQACAWMLKKIARDAEQTSDAEQASHGDEGLPTF